MCIDIDNLVGWMRTPTDTKAMCIEYDDERMLGVVRQQLRDAYAVGLY